MTKISSLDEIPQVRSYLTRVGAEARSLRSAVVKEHRGKYWKDVAIIRFLQNGAIECTSAEHGPTDHERAEIASVWGAYDFPKPAPLTEIINPPPLMAHAQPKDIYEFRDVTGQHIIMVQVRAVSPAGKSYLPFTYWDDGRWRMVEPEGELPLWGLEQLGQHKTAFIHEGAKAARYCRWLAEGATAEARKARALHPWGEELCGAAHLGWIGGALSPRRTDWSPLKRAGIERAYIVADNDAPGKAAVASISQMLRMTTFSVEFSGRFPPAFDLADPFPAEMFNTIDGQQFYTGPTMRELTQPATWATDQILPEGGKGRPMNVLREEFGNLWAYVEEIDCFVCLEMPEILRSETIFNRMVAPFSHASDTASLLVRNYKGRSARVCYRPDQRARLVDHRGANAINLHVPAAVRAKAGDARPWLEFLEYMFVRPTERAQVARWCATLIARPEIRMSYGLLLISEQQGIGKTTLGSAVLAPLVGLHNTGYPGENDVTSAFNDWVAQKRLAIINEIYSGSSWKAYHSLKAVITDQEITVNQKYMRQYVIDNWCHILACSNSMRALKMETDDRRWFYPELAEVPWTDAKFTAFRLWLRSGGIAIIKHWANEFGDYVSAAERAPMTERKREMIEGSRSEAQRAAYGLAEAALEQGAQIALASRAVHDWVSSTVRDRVFETEYELRKAMKQAGMVVWPERMKISGALTHVIMTPQAYDAAMRAEDAARAALIRSVFKLPAQLKGAEM